MASWEKMAKSVIEELHTLRRIADNQQILISQNKETIHVLSQLLDARKQPQEGISEAETPPATE